MMATSLLTGLGFSALATGGIGAAAAFRDRQALRANPPIGRIVDAGGHPVHAWAAGTGEVPVVLIHGASGNLRDFTFRLAPLVARRHRVIAFDRPGLGHTPSLHGRGETLAEQAALLRAALGAMGHERAILLGQSFGGAVALRWALDAPQTVAGLVLVGGVAMPWTTPLDPLYRLCASRLAGALARPAIAALRPKRLVARTLAAIFAPEPIPPGYPEQIGVGLSLRTAAIRANARQVARLLPQVREMAPRYGAALHDMPVEIVHGTADAVVPCDLHARGLAAALPHARLTLLEGAGHMPHHTRADAVAAAVDRIAAQTRPEAAQ